MVVRLLIMVNMVLRRMGVDILLVNNLNRDMEDKVDMVRHNRVWDHHLVGRRWLEGRVEDEMLFESEMIAYGNVEQKAKYEYEWKGVFIFVVYAEQAVYNAIMVQILSMIRMSVTILTSFARSIKDPIGTENPCCDKCLTTDPREI